MNQAVRSAEANEIDILALDTVGGSFPWDAPDLQCVKAVFTSTTRDVASLQTAAGETLLMPVTEFPPARVWRTGEEVLALRVDRGGTVMLSMNRPELVVLLAEGIVPELRDGRVRIMGVSRAPGSRTKLAVAATADGVDPVNSIVGRSANRVRSLGKLLNGERVDVVAWHPDPAVYLANALAPASVLGVEIVDGNATARVPRHQMAGAVGERGLNASLAGQLVGVTVLVVPG